MTELGERGWRFWYLQSGVLCSPVGYQPWPSRWHTARCSRDHPIPDPGCGCGVYMFPTLAHLVRRELQAARIIRTAWGMRTLPAEMVVVGSVTWTGPAYRDTSDRGLLVPPKIPAYRTRGARIEQLYLTPGDARFAQPLRDRYGVPVQVVPGATYDRWLHELGRAHGGLLPGWQGCVWCPRKSALSGICSRCLADRVAAARREVSGLCVAWERAAPTRLPVTGSGVW